MWRGEKALNLAAIVADKPTVGIVIRQLQVRGLILLFVFDRLKFRLGSKISGTAPISSLWPGHTFWGKSCDLGRRFWLEKCDLAQDFPKKCDLLDVGSFSAIVG